MSHNGRITRSSSFLTKNSSAFTELPVSIRTSQGLVRQAIRNKNYDQAQKILKEDTPYKHWHKCLQAKILYQMNQLNKSLRELRISIYFQRQQCCDCLRLLMHILKVKKESIKEFSVMIRQIIELQAVPKDLKNQLMAIVKHNDEPDLNAFDQSQSSYKQLLECYVERGAKLPKVGINQQRKDYRVVIAKDIIEPRQVIIFVPENQIITLEKAKQSEIVKKIQKKDSQLRSPKHCILSVYLLIEREKGRDSMFAKYINSLPKKLDHFPIYYGNQNLVELQKTSFLSILKRKLSDLEEDFNDLTKIIGKKKWFTFENFQWARMIVCSRIFGIVINNKKTDALVPLADMLNHRLPKMATWHFSDQEKGFIVENLDKPINKGQQIYDSYGSKCNSRFLLNYGFIQSNNLANQITISLKKVVNEKIGYQNLRISKNLNSEQILTMLSHYRKLFYEQNNQSANKSTQDIDYDKIISRDIQLCIWSQIYNTFSARLRSFPTTMKFDRKQLGNKLQQNYRNCIQIRLGQKEILDFYIKMAKIMKQYFSNPSKDINLRDYRPYLKRIGENVTKNS